MKTTTITRATMAKAMADQSPQQRGVAEYREPTYEKASPAVEVGMEICVAEDCR
jgi:hypothetical protein